MISKVEEMDEYYRDKVNTSIIGDVDVQYILYGLCNKTSGGLRTHFRA